MTAIYAAPSLFKVTNLPFVLGRPFTGEEDKTGGPLVAVLSESLWRDQFNSDPNIVGRTIILSGESFQVLGAGRWLPEKKLAECLCNTRHRFCLASATIARPVCLRGKLSQCQRLGL